jgi:hypothetical protein
VTLYAVPGEAGRELAFTGFASGLAFPVIGARLIDNVGGTTISRAAVVERPTGSGRYVWVVPAMPGTVGDYAALCDDNSGTLIPGGFADEDVIVTLAPLAPVSIISGGSPGGLGANEAFVIRRNDTLPVLTRQMTQSDGVTPINLDTYHGGVDDLKFNMRRDDAPNTGAPAPKVHADADVTDAPNGIVTYEWVPADTNETTDNAAIFNGEFEATFVDGTIETFPGGVGEYIKISMPRDLDPGIDP